MSVDRIKLPKDKEELAKVVWDHANREDSRLNMRRIAWLIALEYMRGARTFHTLNRATGTIRATILKEDGKFPFQSQEFMRHIDRVVGRLMSGDVRPLVQNEGQSLGGIRERAKSQVVLNATVSDQNLEQVKPTLVHMFALLGCCGLIGHVVDHPTLGLVSDLEVVSPLEILPFPSIRNDYTKVRGIVRQQLVSLDSLKDKFGAKKVGSSLQKMERWERPIGAIMEVSPDGTGTLPFLSGLSGEGNFTSTTGQQNMMTVVKIRELWLDGPRGTCSQYVMASGRHVFINEDAGSQERYCPLGFGRFIENSTFHGAGMFDLMFSMSRELERLLESLFNNIRDMDRYGVLVLPQGSFNQNQVLRDVGRGLRAVYFQPDPVAENFKPFAIQPVNTRDLPGKVAGLAKGLLDGLSPLPDLLEEKGRVDSARGLSVLDETIRESMNTSTRGLGNMFGSVYRSLIDDLNRKMAGAPRSIPVGRLTLDLAGVVIDPETDDVLFGTPPLIGISRLTFTVKEVNPRSRAARESAALELHTQLQLPPEDLILFALEEGIDLPIWMRPWQSPWEMSVRNILLLYGDGETPGEIMVATRLSKPEFQLRPLEAFMSSPTMAVASVDVQEEFIRYFDWLVIQTGMVLPEATPNADDMAMLTAIDQQLIAAQQQLGQPQLQQGVA